MTPEQYRTALEAAMNYPSIRTGSDWNDAFLAGLFRNKLQLTQVYSWLLVYPFAVTAPRPMEDEPTLWPYDSLIIPI